MLSFAERTSFRDNWSTFPVQAPECTYGESRDGDCLTGHVVRSAVHVRAWVRAWVCSERSVTLCVVGVESERSGRVQASR